KPVIETLHPLSAFFPCHHSMNSNAPKYGYGIDPSFKISPLPMPLPSTGGSPIPSAVASVAKVFKFSVQPLPILSADKKPNVIVGSDQTRKLMTCKPSRLY